MIAIPGSALKKFRVEQGWSQTEMAGKIRWSRQKLYYIEKSAIVQPGDARVIDAKLGKEWRAAADVAETAEIKLMRQIFAKVDEIEIRLAEIEDAQGIKHVPVSRSSMKRLQN